MSEQAYVLGTKQVDRWKDVLQRCGVYDIYHLVSYHRLAEEQEGRRATLLVLESGPAIIAMPMLVRQIEDLLGVERSEFCDATSVYGYPGPVSNLRQPTGDLLHHFAAFLHDYFESKKVVAVFSRLHPLFDQEPYLDSLGGEILDIGPTVAIDLSLPPEGQRQKYRINHKRDINKAKREGVLCVHDEDWKHFDAFINIYYDTMRRRGASEYYFFNRDYFSRLRELLEDKIHLFIASKDGVVLSSNLFTLCNSIIQYHLGGTSSSHLDIASSKLVFDTVRLWGNEVGARIFHLGGGVGGREDSLFHFKAGFSNLRYRFRVWRAVIDSKAYQQLVEQKCAWNEAHEMEPIDEEYFPAYRCPTRPRARVD